ncbi:MAG: carbohydrate ABC transporter permease [Clostridia bacterium]|nr:carbohydrate ABC transporter permease [Clostridia bacterium]
MQKKSFLSVCFDIFNYAMLFLISFLCLYPFLYVVFASLSDSNMLMAADGMLLYPLGTNINAYRAVVKNPMIYSGYKNTLIVLFGGLAVNMLLSMLAAYVLSRKEFAIRKAATKFVMFTMFFSGGMIPTYLNVCSLGLDNTLLALILPGAINVYNMVILRSGFDAIPESLIESAKLDGASHTRIMWRIVVPLAMPTIAVIILYYAVAHWNSWFSAMMYLRDREKFPIQLVLREILLQNNTSDMMQGTDSNDAMAVAESIQYAIIVVSTLPILVAYPYIQRFFVKGVMVGAVKG